MTPPTLCRLRRHLPAAQGNLHGLFRYHLCMTTFAITTATRDDVRDISARARACRLRKAEHLMVSTPADFERELFGPNAVIGVHHGWDDGAPWALRCTSTISPPSRASRAVPEDLFVKPECRGKGYGKALLVRLAQIAVERNCGRFEWSVLDWNQPSIDFYHEAMGAEDTARLAGAALPVIHWLRWRRSEPHEGMTAMTMRIVRPTLDHLPPTLLRCVRAIRPTTCAALSRRRRYLPASTPMQHGSSTAWKTARRKARW